MPIWANLKEKSIQHRIKRGDNQAFVWLYDQYAPQIYRFILLKTSSVHDAEDLTSETFLRFWKNCQKDKGNAVRVSVRNPRGFLYQIARNIVIDYWRKKSKQEITPNEKEEEKIERIESNDPDLSQKAVLSSDMEQVKLALNKIKPNYQDLIIWHYLDDFSVKEIAQIMEKPENTIRVQIHRAVKSLKSVMK